MSEQDVTDLKRLISENKSEALEQKKERRQEFAQLADLIKNLTLSQTQNNEQTKESIGIVTHRLEKIEERVEKVEKGGAAMGGDSFIERHKALIENAKYGIKVLGMPGKVTETNAKDYLCTELDLTKATKDNIRITQAYRLGKNPKEESDSCPPVIMIFNTKDMVETILNAARGEGKERSFKEHIPEVYSKQHSEYIRVGVFLRESQQLQYRIRFDEHTLQLQVKKPVDDQYKIQLQYTPKPALRIPIDPSDEAYNTDVKAPTEEDSRKLTITLGRLEMETGTDPKIVPPEILDEMNEKEKDAINKAFSGRVEEKAGNRIEILCKTREDALLLANWKGNQNHGIYTQNPHPECFTHLTWDKQQK